MRQILQSLNDGSTMVADVPCPAVQRGHVLISTETTLVSAGTERMLVDFGRAGWLEKARQQPEKVKQVLDKVRSDGLAPTIEAVRSKLDQPLALGYCNVGRVLAVGEGVVGFAVGDRVVSNGKHAEVVSVPMHLCARIPDIVGSETAAFTVLAAIGLQGLRLADPTLGECVVVSGLGLIGLLTVQLLRAQGCRVLALDYDQARLNLARSLGADVVDLRSEDPLVRADAFSRGRGVDAVLIAASTQSDEPVHLAAQMCRRRGRIVLIGVTGLRLSRADFYEKELSFQVSCSYGPGRYDPSYEIGGNDYPIGFVRWTEQRNFEAVLDLMASGALDCNGLISHRFDLEDASAAYDLLVSNDSSLGILIAFGSPVELRLANSLKLTSTSVSQEAGKNAVLSRGGDSVPRVAVLGAGNYASRVLIPALKQCNADLHCLISENGVSAAHYGRRFGFLEAATSSSKALSSERVNTVVIATRHDSHAAYVCDSLDAGKNVFVEKPLCLSIKELEKIDAALMAANSRALDVGGRAPILMVGFNRRFSPHVQRMRELLATIAAPKAVVITVNAGAIPVEHWTQDRVRGGGRILGEGCHFIDLARHLTGESIVGSARSCLDDASKDTVTLHLTHAGGSISTIHYFSNGHRSLPKERVEIYCQGRILQLDNFRILRGFGWSNFKRQALWRQDKGQVACVRAFLEAVRGATGSPIPWDELHEVSRVSMELA